MNCNSLQQNLHARFLVCTIVSAVAIFQQPEYYNGTGRCWKKKLPLSHGRLNSSAVERKVLFKKLKLNSSSQNLGLGKQNQAILILAIL